MSGYTAAGSSKATSPQTQSLSTTEFTLCGDEVICPSAEDLTLACALTDGSIELLNRSFYVSKRRHISKQG